MHKDGISIIIPCYNSANTIEECLKNVIKQDFDKFEIICVDDASTDNTKDKIKGFHSVIIISNKSNKGAAYSRNKGLNHSIFSNVLFLDSDVILTDNFLKKLYDDIKTSGSEIIFPCITHKNYTSTISPNTSHIWRKRVKNYPLCSACFYINKNCTDKLDEFFDPIYKIYYEDTDLFLRCYYYNIKSSYNYMLKAIHNSAPYNKQKWNKKRLYLEARNTLYSIIKFFPFNTLFTTNRTVKIGMFYYYYMSFKADRFHSQITKKDFFKIIFSSILWNLINLPLTIKKNFIVKKYWIKNLLSYE